MTLYGAIDLHSNNGVVVLLDDQDRVVYERRLANDLAVVLRELAPYRKYVQAIAVESTYNWYWLVDGLMENGYTVKLVNTMAVKTYEGLKYTGDEHDARQIIFGKVSYVLEADIQDYFGSVVREKLAQMLRKRIVDKDVLRLIDKWLHAGVLEDGRLFPSKQGVAQGAVISPLLANVYLHEVLDLWVEQKVKPRLRGEISLFRYADDFVLCFQYRDDAVRVRHALRQRFESFGLKLHPLKTRLMSFGRFERETSRREGRKPNTFDFLGFTFFCRRRFKTPLIWPI